MKIINPFVKPPEHNGINRGRLVLVGALVLGALFAVGGAAWSLGEQIDQNSVDSGQNSRITVVERISDDDPCPQIEEAIANDKMERAAALIEACRQFLSGLANEEIFPHRLACFIASEAGSPTRNCENRERLARADERAAEGGDADNPQNQNQGNGLGGGIDLPPILPPNPGNSDDPPLPDPNPDEVDQIVEGLCEGLPPHAQALCGPIKDVVDLVPPIQPIGP
jgi:hypothetical protein